MVRMGTFLKSSCRFATSKKQLFKTRCFRLSAWTAYASFLVSSLLPPGVSIPTRDPRLRHAENVHSFSEEGRMGHTGVATVLRRAGVGGAVPGVAALPAAAGHPGWLQIPDWFSFENEGGNVAVADLT